MTEQDNILRLAREAGFVHEIRVLDETLITWFNRDEYLAAPVVRHSIHANHIEVLERFAALVRAEAVAETREACAKKCDEMMKRDMLSAGENDGRGSDIAFGRMVAAEELADSIRAMAATPSREGEA